MNGSDAGEKIIMHVCDPALCDAGVIEGCGLQHLQQL